VRDGSLLPRLEPLADPLDRADERDLVHELVRHGRDRRGTITRQEELLDLVGLGLEAHARHQLLVEVALLAPHAADVEAETSLRALEHG
jgi:hypothetical protein